MNLSVSFDQSIGSLPSGFVAAVNYVVHYFDNLFTNNVTVNIHLGYGEIAGQSLAPRALGESETYFSSVSYQQAVGALEVTGKSASQLAAYSTLPGSSPLSGGTLWLTTAQEKAIGLLSGNNAAIDGFVGISSTYPFSYSAAIPPAATQYYLIGVLEHEFTEVMGRDSPLGEGLGGTQSYSIMDLFRFSAPGTRQLGTGGPAYFSINNGNTNLDNWNTNPNGDLGDWAAGAGADSFLAFAPSGQINDISTTDLTLMSVIGWNTIAAAPTVTSVSAVTDNHATQVGAGHVVTITLNVSESVNVTGAPTLQLNDNEVAAYSAGSGTSTLAFTYTVQPGDNTTDLKVTALNLPSGASIHDSAGNNLSGGVTGDLGIIINEFSAGQIQAADFAITRTTLPPDQATSIANSINSGAQTEAQFINNLLSQVADTTIPAVAVEGSMYGMVGTSAEITLLVTQFLSNQVASAMNMGLNPTVLASEALGLAFAFSNETGSSAFATAFGPSNASMPSSAAGDSAFAAAASNAIFGSASTANLVNAMQTWVANWKTFYSNDGIPGLSNATTTQIDLAARGAAWGDAVGVALANNIGPLKGEAINFLDDAVQGTATYSAPLLSQVSHISFQGEAAKVPGIASECQVHLVGVLDHVANIF